MILQKSTLGLVTFHAAQLGAQPFLAFFRIDHPGTVHPRRIVTNVLGVPALQIGDPVQPFVLMKSDDLAPHAFPVYGERRLPRGSLLTFITFLGPRPPYFAAFRTTPFSPALPRSRVASSAITTKGRGSTVSLPWPS